MGLRTQLQTKLEELLGSKNVYYQAPSRLTYPCIKYERVRPKVLKADDIRYIKRDCYQLTVISQLPDNPVIEKILDEFEYSSEDRHFVSDNLHHNIIILYY